MKEQKLPLSSLILVLVLCLFPAFQTEASSVIFVHLGKSIPSCLFTTLKQARYLNPNCDIYLLSDHEGYQGLQGCYQDLLDEEGIDLIDMNLIPKTSQHEEFYIVNKLVYSFVEGFWAFATERFFILYDFIKDQGLTDVLHLESDSMIYMSLDELFPVFDRLNIRLAAPFQSLKGCIPCFVFIKDGESLTPLIEHMLTEMKNFKGTKPHLCVNDMQTLASFYGKFGASALFPLPTLMPEYAKTCPKRRSSFVEDNSTPLSFLFLYADQFSELLFDAAGLGIFINGNDRKYSPHRGPGTIHSRLLFDPHFFSFLWGKNNIGQNVPYLSFQGKTYRIVNMHFHSKMPEEYASFSCPLGKLPARSGI
jgi:hypothetical protein